LYLSLRNKEEQIHPFSLSRKDTGTVSAALRILVSLRSLRGRIFLRLLRNIRILMS
jgi:hypothetical protein